MANGLEVRNVDQHKAISSDTSKPESGFEVGASRSRTVDKKILAMHIIVTTI